MKPGSKTQRIAKASSRHSLASRLPLDQVIDFLPDPTFAIDLQGRVTIWNRAMEKLTGVKAGDMTGKGDHEYALPFYGERRPVLIDLAIKTDPEEEERYPSLIREGDSLFAEIVALPPRRHLWVKAGPLYDKAGTVIGAIESVRDVTEDRRIEETLHRSEGRYRNIFLHVSDYLYIHDLDGAFLETNLASKKATGYSEEDLQGLSVKDLLPDRHRHRFKNYMKNVLDKGYDEGFLTIKTKTGQERVLEYRNSLITDAGGIPVAVQGSARDITARLSAQQQLKKERDLVTSIIQTSPAFFAALDGDGRIILMNQAMLTALNYAMKGISGRDFTDTVIHQDDRDPMREAIRTMVSARIPVAREIRMTSRDGRDLLVQWQGKPVFRDNGTLDFIFGIGIDITGQRQAEEQILVSERKFQAAFQSSADPMSIFDPETRRFIDINLAFTAWSGYSRDEVIGRTTREITLWHDAKDRRWFIDELSTGHTIENVEVLLRKRTGELRHMLLSARMVDVRGRSYIFSLAHDITELRRAEERLKESEERYRILAENARDVIWVLDTDLHYLFVSPSVERMRGYTVKEVMGQSLEEIMTPESYRIAVTTLREELEREEKGLIHDPFWSRTMELELVRKDGSTIWTEITATFLRDPDGRVTGVLGITRDISERMAAEQLLRESERKYRQLMEQAGDGIFVIAADGRFTLVNSRTCEILGYSEEEMYGMSIMDTYPDDLRDVGLQRIELLRSGERLRFERPMVCRDGSTVLVEASASKLSDGSLQAIIHDITERKRSEAELHRHRHMLERAQQIAGLGYWEFDLNKGTVWASSEARRIYGLEKDAWTIESVQKIPLPEYRQALDEEMNRLIRHEKGYDIEFTILRPTDGAVIDIHSIAEYNAEKRKIFGIIQDITERKRSEAGRKIYEERLMRSQNLEALGTLAGGIAHDFNNILSAIIGYSELAQDELPEGNPASRSIQEVLKAGDRAKDLVRQILTFSRQVDIERMPVRIQPIIKEALRLVRSSIPSTIAIKENLDPSAGTVMANPTHIHQVLMNLCTNAYHAMLSLGGILTITLDTVFLDAAFSSRHPPLMEGPAVRLSVQDTGCGMDEETMKRIFDPFFTTKDKGHGTGLGLATVHGIVTDLGGAILVKSAKGSGSTFDIYLPLAGDEHEDEEEPEEEPAPGNGETILLVDDEDAIVQFMLIMLHQLGYRVVSLPSGTEALEAFREDPGRYDLILTDQTMPDMTGSSLAVEVLRIRPGTPIILMTGYSETMSPEEALALGIEEYLEKPFTKGALARAIQRCIRECARA